MDVCTSKMKNAAPSGCVLHTTEILYDKNYQPSDMPEFTTIINKRAVTIYLSKNVNIKFIVVDWLECPHVFLNYNAYSAISKNIMFIFKHRIHIIRIVEFFSLPHTCFLRYTVYKIYVKSAKQPESCGLAPVYYRLVTKLEEPKWIFYLIPLFAVAWRVIESPSLTQCVSDRLRPSSQDFCPLLFSILCSWPNMTTSYPCIISMDYNNGEHLAGVRVFCVVS